MSGICRQHGACQWMQYVWMQVAWRCVCSNMRCSHQWRDIGCVFTPDLCVCMHASVRLPCAHKHCASSKGVGMHARACAEPMCRMKSTSSTESTPGAVSGKLYACVRAFIRVWERSCDACVRGEHDWPILQFASSVDGERKRNVSALNERA